METIIRHVRDLDFSERSALEHLVGHSLHDNQHLVIQVVNAEAQPATRSVGDTLPEWCNVYEGLSDEEIAGVEQTVLRRADLSRRFE